LLDADLTCNLLFVQGKRVAVSGSGNVAVYTVEKLLELGATVLTVSDSTGYVYFEEGMTKELLDAVNDHKVIKRGRLSNFKSGARPTPDLSRHCVFRD
jgi:glutamate dehydrogenase (NADP+)